MFFKIVPPLLVISTYLPVISPSWLMVVYFSNECTLLLYCWLLYIPSVPCNFHFIVCSVRLGDLGCASYIRIIADNIPVETLFFIVIVADCRSYPLLIVAGYIPPYFCCLDGLLPSLYVCCSSANRRYACRLKRVAWHHAPRGTPSLYPCALAWFSWGMGDSSRLFTVTLQSLPVTSFNLVILVLWMVPPLKPPAVFKTSVHRS